MSFEDIQFILILETWW